MRNSLINLIYVFYPNNFFHSHSTTTEPITQKIKFFKYPALRSCTLNSEPMKAPT